MNTNPKKRSLISQSLSFAFDALVGNIGAWIVMCLTIFGFAIIGWAIIAMLAMGMGVIDCLSPTAFFPLMTGERIYQLFIRNDTPLVIAASVAMTLVYFIYASMILGLVHTMIQFYTTGQIQFRPCLKLNAIMSFFAACLMSILLITGGWILLIVPVIIVIMLLSFIGYYIVTGGLILLIVSVIIVIMRSIFIAYYIVDKNMGPIEAFKASWALTRGKSGIMFAFFVIFFLLGLIPIIGWLGAWLMTVYAYRTLEKKTL